ncbi:unnamed protein product [Cochlearia groenlandica]
MMETLDAFCEEGKVREAVETVEILEDNGHVVDLQRLLALAKLCGEAEALEEANVVHDCIIDSSPSSESLSENGEGEVAINMFTRYKDEGNKPDKSIFKAVFFVCASLCDINEGLLHFESMHKDYGIIPSMEDYVSVTEMLASCGYIEEALDFVERMNVEPNVEVWETLMNLCWVHGDLELGDRFAELVKKLDETRMNKESNQGLVAKKASDLAKEKLKTQRPRRPPSSSQFRAGDIASHPESDRIAVVLSSLKVHMLEMGFVPTTKLVIEYIDEEEKEQQLLFRSGKLAVAVGMLNTNPRSSVTVIGNLRICVDGHNTFKMISLITGRQLVSRDQKRFHHIRNGVCSCQDYW